MLESRMVRIWALGAGLLSVGLLGSGCGGSSASLPNTDPASGGAAPLAAEIPGHYIVVLKEGAATTDVAGRHRVIPDATYSHALNGFAMQASAEQAKAMANDANVAFVEPDRVVTVPEPPGTAQTRSLGRATETVPTGIGRIAATANTDVDVSSVGIAIIDTGIAPHLDLNLAGGVSFVSGVASSKDDNGHGTHVAGIAAAKLNGFGIRGVAPNARLYAVKVLDRTGAGTLSSVIAGVNWVTQNAPKYGIKVANMSLVFPGSSFSLNLALNNSVAAGVTYVVAAGNNHADARYYTPAGHPKVICVSAMADSDGMCGALGAATTFGKDDSFASFSNYGSVVKLAAPGVGILSTYLNGQFATMSGTSMASPHVAGAAALYIASHPGVSPANVLAGLLSAATPQSPVTPTLDSLGLPSGGFTGDPDTYPEPLVCAEAL